MDAAADEDVDAVEAAAENVAAVEDAAAAAVFLKRSRGFRRTGMVSTRPAPPAAVPVAQLASTMDEANCDELAGFAAAEDSRVGVMM